MAWFDDEFKTLFRHYVQTAIFATLILATAFGLSYVGEFFRNQGRPEWMIIGVEFVEKYSYLIDLLIWCMLVTESAWEVGRSIFKRLR